MPDTPTNSGMVIRAKALLLAIAFAAITVVLFLFMVFTCWDSPSCGKGLVLVSLGEMSALAVVLCVAVMIVGSVQWLRHRVTIALMTVLMLALWSMNAWSYWQDSGSLHQPVAGWLVGFTHNEICYVDHDPELHCVEGTVPGLQQIQPGDAFEGVLLRERRTAQPRLLIELTGPRVTHALPKPGLPIPDAAVVRAQHVWVSPTGAGITAAAPSRLGMVLRWTDLVGPPIGGAYVVTSAEQELLPLQVTLTCPDTQPVTLWQGGRPADGVQAFPEKTGWLRLSMTVPNELTFVPFYCGPVLR